ncbi:MAG: hypothetical protein Q9169_002690 [Polycauliona sp. 2 TL-2023]
MSFETLGRIEPLKNKAKTFNNAWIGATRDSSEFHHPPLKRMGGPQVHASLVLVSCHTYNRRPAIARRTNDTPRGNEGFETASMSAAKNETDKGPDKEDSDLENGQEQDVPEFSFTEVEAVAEDEEETSESRLLNAESQRQHHPIQPTSPDIVRRPSSADGSLSIPDDTPSLQNSVTSSAARGARLSPYARSPTPSLRPFDRRFQARLPSSPQGSSRAVSPAFLQSHSRQTSVNSLLVPKNEETEQDQAPWEVVRWTKLRKISGQAFSEVGKRNFGRPVCIAISTSIALGTSKGVILVFDYNQNLKSIIGPATKAVESGAVMSISIAADHSTIAGGHASGHIFTWDLAKPAKPFLHIPPVDRRRTPETDGHATDAAIVHLGFLGMRHTALVSADDKGMAFSHLATRGMGSVARSVKTTRILGRYPEATPMPIRQRKPSSVLAFSPLPMGSAEHTSDTMGLVAMLTPYLLVIVSTTPIAQTQYKTPRPKEVAAHSAMTAALAWFPSVKLKVPNTATSETSSRVKLVYCWSNVLMVLEVTEVEPSASSGAEGPPNLQFRSRSRWKSQEGIVAVQWLGRSVLAVLTITQQLVILEDSSLRETNSADLIQKHIFHVDLFSQQLNMLVEELDEEDASMHGVVADAFYMSFRAYKGRLFLLGFNELSFGTLSNWADRLLALMEEGSHIGAITLATSYYTGEADKVSVGLPDDDVARHRLVRHKLLEMITASLRFTFGDDERGSRDVTSLVQIQELAGACISACVGMEEIEFLFDDVYTPFSENEAQDVFFETLEPSILDEDVKIIPPTVLKDLVRHYTDRDLHSRLEELLCHLDPRTMDLDQITGLCKRNHLYDALLYVWNQALDDYTTILGDLLDLVEDQEAPGSQTDPIEAAQKVSSASKIFPYMSYILTSRVYPTGQGMDEGRAILAKAEIYNFFFPGSSRTALTNGDSRMQQSKRQANAPYPNLRKVLDFDAPSFLSMLNEAFEDPFLNTGHDRQRIVSTLLEVMVPPQYEAEDTIYLDMFVARSLPKFPQFILLNDRLLHRILTGLCHYPSEDVAEDCQLSVEYLLSVYQPPDSQSLVPLLSEAGFYRVLRSVYRAEKEYAKLVQTCFDEGPANEGIVFECVAESLRSGTAASEKQADDVRDVVERNAAQFVHRDPKAAAATIEQFAPSLHEAMLKALDEASDDDGQLLYLQTILDPLEESTRKQRSSIKNPNKVFVELYVRLLCEHDPHHVNEYIEGLKTGDLRLEEVLPALENSGAVDAAVILMAREGRVRDAMSRLTQHLETLEAALLGLLDAAADSPDIANTAEATQDLVVTIQRFTRVGLWLCQGQTRSAQQHHKTPVKRNRRGKVDDEELSMSELLWLDLIDAVVQVAKHATEVLQPDPSSNETNLDDDTKPHEQPFDTSKMTAELRNLVQETFTALLSATSVPRTNESLGANVSFLRILRAFLSRASASSPSLSSLRSVLSTIFSAYAYEERLLDLANRLLDKDLFVHVSEAATLRRRGWRPLGQACEGCGKRVWGPGAGGYVWEAWRRKEEEVERMRQQRHMSQPDVAEITRSRRNGKGKAAQEEVQSGSSIMTSHHRGREEVVEASGDGVNDELDKGKGGSGPLMVFSCRHLFHRICLEQMQGAGAMQDEAERPRAFFDDPTHGYVDFVDQSTARTKGLLESGNRTVTLRADSTNVASGRGRDSLRLTSKAKYNHGLIVVDLAHMPGNACGVWPAFWTTGPNWPSSGEIDILEGVNLQPGNAMTMHTSEGCSLVGSSCFAHKGCTAKGGAFGDGFNLNNGGIYAMEWTSKGIKMWFFSRGQEPDDILGESPDPAKWANPISNFQGGSNCNIDSHFKDQQIVFDTTFCGDWAGKEWEGDNVCGAKAKTCEEYVRDHPEAFGEAYWTVNGLKVYVFDGSTTTASESTKQPEPSIPIATSVSRPLESASSGDGVPQSEPSIPLTTSVSTHPSESQAPSTLPSTSTSISPTPSHTQPSSSSSGTLPSTPAAPPPLVTSYIDGGPVTVLVSPGNMVTQIVTGAPVTVTLPPGVAVPQQQNEKEEEVKVKVQREISRRVEDEDRSGGKDRDRRMRDWRVRRRLRNRGDGERGGFS